VPSGGNPLPLQIFDGHRLVPIKDYLEAHPRPDLLDLEQRMDWLATGPYGNRRGDILLMSKKRRDANRKALLLLRRTSLYLAWQCG